MVLIISSKSAFLSRRSRIFLKAIESLSSKKRAFAEYASPGNPQFVERRIKKIIGNIHYF